MASPAEEGVMTRSFHRTLIVPSLLAGIGSFVIEVGKLFISPEISLDDLPMPSREVGITACIAIIAFAIGGLVVIHLLRGSSRRK
jgi:hypothetical protein